MTKNEYWERFLKTGKVEDYINYKIKSRKEDTEFAAEPLESDKHDPEERGNSTKND
jgi:hypothetical protein